MAAEGSTTPASRAQEARVVFGYLRAEVVDELEIALWRIEIKAYCRQNDLRLVTVFVDRGVPGDQLARPGLDGLLDVLLLPDTFGVVVPDIGHLSNHQEVLAGLALLVARSNAHVLVIYDDCEHEGSEA